jgi:hypothetical protein
MTYNYSTTCHVCHEILDVTQLPKNNTPTELGCMSGNDYVLLKMRPTNFADDGRGRGIKVSYHAEINYRHRFHGEAGERPYQMM